MRINEILNCMCIADGMETSIPECEACIASLLEGDEDVDFEGMLPYFQRSLEWQKLWYQVANIVRVIDLSELRNYCDFQVAESNSSSNGTTTVVPNGADATLTASLAVVQ